MPLLLQSGQTIYDSTARDAFQRLRVSSPETLFDSKLVVADNPLYWDDQQTSGSGTTSTYQTGDACMRMAVALNTTGTRVRQTFRRFNYQPGKSQLVFQTFNFNGAVANVTKRVGLFDGNNGIFFQTSGTTLAFVIRKAGFDRVFTQSVWNVDLLNGTGISGYTLDVTKAQILVMDFEWLGVGQVRFGFVINGKIVVCHVQPHANIISSVYMSNPNLPLRYEISNNGSGAATTLDCICSTVTSEGGSAVTGTQFGADRALTPLQTANATTLYPVLGIRLKSTYLHATIHPVEVSVLCDSSATFRYSICINPTLAGTAPTWTAITNSAVEEAVTTTNASSVTSEGLMLNAGYSVAGATANASEASVGGFVHLGSTIAGVSDQLWICAQRLTGTTENFYATFSWREEV